MLDTVLVASRRGRPMKPQRILARIARAEALIAAAGYQVRYVEYCEDAATPGIIGMYRGVTDRRSREVKVATRGATQASLADVLEHELRHVQEPTWDCGNRPLGQPIVTAAHSGAKAAEMFDARLGNESRGMVGSQHILGRI